MMRASRGGPEAELRKLDPREIRNLSRLNERLKGSSLSPEAVGEILPEAVAAVEEKGREFSKSMVEVTERAIDYSVNRNPDTLSTALFPIIGAAIRKALNQFLSDFMNGINARLESTLSVTRLKWRIEARRKGLPYAEVLIRHTLRFRVEHLLLIHVKTGILLHHLSREGSQTADNDMVASMLTVVKDYIKDSFSVDRREAVNIISVGELSLIIEEGPLVSLAAVCRGTPDQELRMSLQEAVAAVHSRLSKQLKSFSGDTAAFERAEDLLKPCLISRDMRGKKKKPVFAIVAVSFLAAILIYFAVMGILAQRRTQSFIEALSREPGIMVVSRSGSFGRQGVKLLRDSRARTVEEVAGGRGIDLSKFNFETEAFYSPAFSEAPGIPEELLEIARRLGEYTILFTQDSGEPRPGQEAMILEAGTLVSSLVEKAKAAGVPVHVEVTGHSAGNVQDGNSLAVSEERAKKAMGLFTELNPSLLSYVKTRGVGVSEPVVKNEATEEDRVLNRSVTFKAVFE